MEGTWFLIGAVAFAISAMLVAYTTYYVLTWRQDREEDTRPARRRLVSIEEINARSRRSGTVASLVFAGLVIVVIVALTAFGI